MGFSEIDIVPKFFSTVEPQGANGRFQVRDRDGANDRDGREAVVVVASGQFPLSTRKAGFCLT